MLNQLNNASNPSLDANFASLVKPRRRTGKWWQIRFRDYAGNEQAEVFELSIQAEFRLDELSRCGIQCRIRRCLFDVFVFDSVSGSWIAINSRMTRLQAAHMAFEWTGVGGVLVWPCGEKLPRKFTIGDQSGKREGGVAA